MSADMEMMNYKTTYNAGNPVDFLAVEGPLRADEYIGREDEYDSRQVLTVPPQEAPIWKEWYQHVQRRLGERAVDLAS